MIAFASIRRAWLLGLGALAACGLNIFPRVPACIAVSGGNISLNFTSKTSGTLTYLDYGITVPITRYRF
jgi:hypothetical protein